MKRKIIRIDEEKCTGCGACIPGCPEGAIQLIDGKARLVGDLYCDGLGACLGTCPEGAITIEEREAEPYSERKVMENIVKQGPNTIRAHLEHLREHGEYDYLREAQAVLREKGVESPPGDENDADSAPPQGPAAHGGCPGMRSMSFSPRGQREEGGTGPQPSQLTHWPIQLHLISPAAPHYRGADLLLAADCTAFARGAFHGEHLKGKALAIACPKLDEGQEIYLEKLKALIDEARINSLTVMIMQVPCCRGLLRLAQAAAEQAERKVPITCQVVGIDGGVTTLPD